MHLVYLNLVSKNIIISRHYNTYVYVYYSCLVYQFQNLPIDSSEIDAIAVKILLTLTTIGRRVKKNNEYAYF